MKIDVTPFALAGSVDGLLSDFTQELEKITQGGLSLTKIDLDERAGTPGTFDYKLTCWDGRKWKQTLRLDGSAQIWHTFDVTDEFLLAEFAAFRPMRDLLEQFIHQGCTKLKVDF